MTKKIVVPIAVLLMASLVGGVIYFRSASDQKRNTATSSETAEVNTIDYGPPTEPERAAGDQQKEEIVKKTETSSTPPDTAEVVVVDAGQYDDVVEVRAFISNVIKDGTCTVSITNGQLEVTKDSSAFKDATTTQCSPFKIPRSEFSQTGTWNVIVSYQAEGISGKSKNKTIEIK